jgi:probable rRNA maturation factor
MIYFSVIDKTIVDIQEDSIIAAAAAVLTHQSVDFEGVDLSIVVDDNSSLQDLNREYRDIDAPTDVLSFALNEKDPDTGRLYLGDVIISYQQAQDQAGKAGHPTMSELQLLTVHGVLHLLGHDHAEPDEKAQMWVAQKEILDSLHVIINQWPED